MNWCGDTIRRTAWILFTLIAFIRMETAQAQGLGFYSNDRPVSERTSYNVFDGKAPRFNQQLTMAVDLSFNSGQQFGYIFTLIDPRNKSYSLSFRLEDDQQPWLHFNIDKEASKLKLPLEKSWLNNSTWISLIVHFDLVTDRVDLTLNGKQYQASEMGLQAGMEPELVFGRYTTYTDVPVMAIRNLKISGGPQELSFPLNEWSGNKVTDAQGNAIGKVENPNWLIKEAHYWKKRMSHTFKEVAGSSFIPHQNRVVAFTKDSLLSFQLGTETITGVKIENPLPISRLILGRSAWDSVRQQIWVYEANNLPIGDTTIALLDLEKKRWTPVGKAYIPQQRHHHNLIQQDSTWILFGGYGSFQYFNGFYRYVQAIDQWQPLKMTGDSIDPRFFSSIGAVGKDGEYLLFGGFGNPTGEQVIGGRNYYDCYRINSKTQRIERLWEQKLPDQQWVPAGNLVMDSEGAHFYVLGYPHHLPKSALQLYKFSLADGHYEIVSDSIPFTSEKIETEVNLYRNAPLNELVCVVQEFRTAQESTVSIYTLKDPPVAFDPAKQAGGTWFGHKLWWILVLVPLLFYLFRRRKNEQEAETRPTSNPEPAGNQSLSASTEPAPPIVAQLDCPEKNAGYLLGDFLAFDKRGMDISHHFSPKIRQLFLLLVVSSRPGKKGVSSRVISSNLWPDRDMASTKNIRGVTINALRNILLEWEGVQLNYVNDSYLLELEPGFFCDYYQALDYLQAPVTDGNRLLSYLPLLTRGPLFSGVQEAFLDEYKFEFETVLVEKATDLLTLAARSDGWQQPYYQLAKVVHLADPFHEKALSYQLVFLRKTKGMEAARKKFETFQAEYERSLGQAYPLSFEEAAQI